MLISCPNSETGMYWQWMLFRDISPHPLPEMPLPRTFQSALKQQETSRYSPNSKVLRTRSTFVMSNVGLFPGELEFRIWSCWVGAWHRECSSCGWVSWWNSDCAQELDVADSKCDQPNTVEHDVVDHFRLWHARCTKLEPLHEQKSGSSHDDLPWKVRPMNVSPFSIQQMCFGVLTSRCGWIHDEIRCLWEPMGLLTKWLGAHIFWISAIAAVMSNLPLISSLCALQHWLSWQCKAAVALGAMKLAEPRAGRYSRQGAPSVSIPSHEQSPDRSAECNMKVTSSRSKNMVDTSLASCLEFDYGECQVCLVNCYIYIYAGELVSVPLFSLSRVSFGTTSRVRNSTTSWGAHFRTTKIGFFWGFLWQILVPISVFVFCVLGPISELSLVSQHLAKIGFFEDFCDKFWCQLVFLCFVFWAQLVSSHLLVSILQKKNCFWARRSKNLGFFFDIAFQKNTIKIGFF